MEREDEQVVIDLPDLASQHEGISTTFSIQQNEALDALNDCNNGSQHDDEKGGEGAGTSGAAAGAARQSGNDVTEDEERAEVEATNAPTGKYRPWCLMMNICTRP